MERDCRVLHSFKIMDYSLLLAIYNLDKHKDTIRESTLERKQQNLHQKTNSSVSDFKSSEPPEDVFDEIDEEQNTMNKIEKTWRDRHGSNCASPMKNIAKTPRISKYTTATGQIMASTSNVQRRLFDEELNHWSGGIPAFTNSGQRLLLYIGVIDILQHYKFRKKVEHHVKSLIYDGDTVSVHKPSFYKARFETFMKTKVFRPKKKDPTARSMPNLQPKGFHKSQMSSLPRHISGSQRVNPGSRIGNRTSITHKPPIIQVHDSSPTK